MTKTQNVLYEAYAGNETVISEMTNDGAGQIDVPVSAELIEKMKDGDNNPLFVTIEVLNEGTSVNGRKYTKEALFSVAEQINSKHPVGYMGHLLAEERKHKFPDVQTIWLGAVVKEVDGKLRLFAKGYVLPEATKLRTYLKKAKAANSNVAVSIYGVVRSAVRNASVNMANLILESIDWARPGAEGVKNGGYLVVASEMADVVDNLDGKDKDMTKEEALQSATASELKEHVNPEVIAEMVSEAEAAHETVVQEMTETHETVVQEMQQELTSTKAELREYQLNDELRSKVENPAARKVIRNLVVAEMTDDTTDLSAVIDNVLGSETGKTIIQEMTVAAPPVRPQIDKPAVVARKYTTKK